MNTMLRIVAVLCLAAAAAIPARAQTGDLAVEIQNHSEPVLCAEKDNVYLSLQSPRVRRLQIQAVHPAYIGTIVADRFAPDWTACDIPINPSDSANVRRVTIYETPDLQLVGLIYPSFWRPATVPVRVGNRSVEGLHLVQLWVRHQERAEEVLVLYPPDGYWRARPLPPAHMKWTAYGSSFLFGPVEVSGRPLVDLREVRFEPSTRTFSFGFARGGSGQLRVATLDQDRIVLDATLSSETPTVQPFAALRSMYVTDTNADVARVAWRGKDVRGWDESPIMTFRGASAVELWAGRSVPSRHNTSAPDMVFSRFRAEEGRPR